MDLLAAGRDPGDRDEQRVLAVEGLLVLEAELAPQVPGAMRDDLVVTHELEHRAGAGTRPGAGALDLLLLALGDDLALHHGRFALRAPRAGGTLRTGGAGGAVFAVGTGGAFRAFSACGTVLAVGTGGAGGTGRAGFTRFALAGPV